MNSTPIRLSTFNFQPTSLPFVFALAEALEHGEPGLFGVGDGQRLEFLRRIEGGNDFAHRLFTGRTLLQLRRADRSPQGELPAANLTLALAKLVFVKRHETALFFQKRAEQINRQRQESVVALPIQSPRVIFIIAPPPPGRFLFSASG